MLLINFSHPLTPAHQARVECLTGQRIERIICVKTQFDNDQSFVEQARHTVDAVGLSSDQWQTASLLINLPGHSAVAALILAVLHGRCGYFPAILRLRPVPSTTPPQFEVAEVLNMQFVRESARLRR